MVLNLIDSDSGRFEGRGILLIKPGYRGGK
jgi:hypothetical protein